MKIAAAVQKREYKGSVTVEASLLMGVILMVLFLIIQMTLFLTDSVRMTAILAEDSTYTEAENGERSEWLASQKKGLFFLNPDRIRHTAGSSSITDTYPAEAISLGYGINETADQEITRSVRHPAVYLRTVQAVKNCGKSG